MTMLCTPALDVRADLFEVCHGNYKTLHDNTGVIRFIDYPWDQNRPAIEPSQLILSYHNFEETPSDLEELLQNMQKKGPARFYKIATWARSTLDALRMLEFVKSHPHVIGLCMGELGQITRILAPVVGTPIMYASFVEENALGQIPLATLLDTYHFRKLTPKTPIYGVIGDPIAQSPGHIYHNGKMQGEGVYIKMRITSLELSAFFSYVRSLPFQGLSVTIPHKEEVLEFLDETPAMGAVNTICLKEDRLIGSNTDGIAVLQLLGNVKGKKIVILGAGGSARAIGYVAIQEGAEVTIFNRTLEKAQKLAEDLNCLWHDTIGDYDILINATASNDPLEEEYFHPQLVVVDLSLNPESYFLKRAAQSGAHLISGQQVYEKQASLQRLAWQFEKVPEFVQNNC